MAYFNHAYKKTFLALIANDETETENNPAVDAGLPELPGSIMTAGGLLDSNGVHISYLKETGLGMGPGTTGFFAATDSAAQEEGGKDLSIRPSDLSTGCCPFYVASAAIKTQDKQGPYHGGYLEANKSKMINPKYIRKFWMAHKKEASRAVLEIGGTASNIEANADCAKTFLCGEDYNLRIDIKGTAALRFANHNLYHTFQANGGCCANPTLPTSVSPESIYLQWAEQIAESEFTKDFVRPIVEVTHEDPVNPGSTIISSYAADAASAVAEGLPAANVFSAIGALTGIESAGLILIGSYVDTKFGNCTFQVSDFYGKDPLQLFASEVDYNGDPCTFEGLCVTDACKGIPAEGLGETVLRDVIQAETYLQNFFASDLRIREITQGTAALDIIDRSKLYDKAFILHSVPRFNNPTGVFDNDQYLLEIVGENQTIEILKEAFTGINENCTKFCEEIPEYKEEKCIFTLNGATPADEGKGKERE